MVVAATAADGCIISIRCDIRCIRAPIVVMQIIERMWLFFIISSKKIGLPISILANGRNSIQLIECVQMNGRHKLRQKMGRWLARA